MAVYKERTYLPLWLRWLTGLLVAGAMIFAILANTIWETDGDDQLIAVVISLVAGLVGLAIAFMLNLDIKMTGDAIEYRLFPVEWRKRVIKVGDIASMEVRKLKVFPRYGGFGRRIKPWKKEIAYILNRNAALYVKLKNGKTRVFSTAAEAKLKRFIRNTYPGNN